LSWVAVGVTAVSGAIKIGEGISQNSKANAIEKSNPYPTEGVQQEYSQNVNTAQQLANQGIAAPAYNNQSQAIQQNQAGALQTLSRSANPGANLASIVRQGDQATNNLNAQDALARNRNMLNLLQQRSILAQQKDKAWDWNFQQKYLGNLAKSQALRGSANANINSGVNDFAGGGLAASRMGAFNGSGSVADAPDGSSISAQGGTDSGMGQPGFNPYGSNGQGLTSTL